MNGFYSKQVFGFSFFIFGFCSAQAGNAQAPKMQLSDCAIYKDFAADIDYRNPKSVATNYMNGALNWLEASLGHDLSATEIQKRDTCVLLALQAGADANNTQSNAAPILQAVSNKDEVAVNALLRFKANPNAKEKGFVDGSSISVLHLACESGNENIALALISAGADPAPNQALWEAASFAESRVVETMIKTGKVPKDQLTHFSEIGDDAQTALDTSEIHVSALNEYFKKFKDQSSVSEKLEYVNGTIIYAYYIWLPSLKKGSDPDAFVNDLLKRQLQVSSLLKSAGWSCHQPNCGIAMDEVPDLNDLQDQ